MNPRFPSRFSHLGHRLSTLAGRRAVRKTALILVIACVTLILASLLFRNAVLSYYLDRRIAAFNTAYGAELKVEKAQIRWFSALRVTGISLRPAGGDTLVKIDTVTARLHFFRMIGGRISLSDLELRHAECSFVRHDSITNYMFLLDRTPRRDSADSTVRKIDFGARLGRILGIIFDKIPERLTVRDVRMEALSDGHEVRLTVDHAEIRDHRFSFPVRVQEDSLDAVWNLEGLVEKSRRTVDVTMHGVSGGRVTMPFIGYRWNAGISLDTMAFRLTARAGETGETVVEGTAGVTGLSVSHRRIAARPVGFGTLRMDYVIRAGDGFIELDSASQITFERLRFNPYFCYRRDTSHQIALSTHVPWFPAEDLFASLPEGLFIVVSGIKTEGELAFRLDFAVDLSRPDSLRFDSELLRRGFRIRSYGISNLTRMDSTFEYTAYEGDVPVRTFSVGPENPMFRPLERIPAHLQYSVLTAEDGGYYQHRGFLTDALRESIAANIKERRFVRGGSTITMQLVKNVFLSRSKTIARKLEEMLIVWMIENHQLTSKERMLEVYLNIIEWGPGIYGAAEASRFYFNKDVTRLTYAESIFLASIIPKPKWYRSSFDSSGHLRPEMAGYYRLVSQKMLAKGWISQQETDRLVPDVELKGAAASRLNNLFIQP